MKKTPVNSPVNAKKRIFMFVLAGIVGISALTYVAAKSPVGDYVFSSFAKTNKNQGKICKGNKPHCGSKKSAICKGGDWTCVSNEKAANYNGTTGATTPKPVATKPPCKNEANNAANCTDVPLCAVKITAEKCAQGSLENSAFKCKIKNSSTQVTIWSCCGVTTTKGIGPSGKLGCYQG